MAAILFWTELVAGLILLVAFFLTLAARRKRRLWRVVMLTPPVFVLIGLWVVALSSAIAVQVNNGGFARGIAWLSVCLGLWIIGVVLVWRKARRKVDDRPAAAFWPLSKLGLATAASLLLAVVTFWSMNLSAQQELARIRAEMTAVALEVAPAHVPDSQNAALAYNEALAILHAKAGTTSWEDRIDAWLRPSTSRDQQPETRPASASTSVPATKPTDFASEEIQSFLKERQGAIDLARLGGRLPGYDLGYAYNLPSIDKLTPGYSRMRSLAKLLALSARSNAATHRPAEAVSDISAQYALAQHMSNEPPLIGLLVADAMEIYCFSNLQTMMQESALPTDALARIEVSPFVSYARSMKRSLRLEETFMVSTLAGQYVFYDLVPSWFPMESDWAQGQSLANSPLYCILFARKDINLAHRWFAEYSTMLDKPYYSAGRKWPPAEPAKKPGGLLARVFLPMATISVGRQIATADAQHQLVLVARVLWQYRVKHGKYPQELAELAPEFIPAVPVDPFSGKDFIYKSGADGRWILYSIGPDMKDDGGTEYDKKTQKGDFVLIIGTS